MGIKKWLTTLEPCVLTKAEIATIFLIALPTGFLTGAVMIMLFGKC